MKPTFFTPRYETNLRIGTNLTSPYIKALLAEKFVITTDNFYYYLTNPKGVIVYQSMKCRDGWFLFLRDIPKILLNLKTLRKHLQNSI